MKRILLYNSILMLLLYLVACNDPFSNQLFVDESDDELRVTNATYLDDRSEDFSLFIELLHYADLYNALNDASKQSTLFAPDNDAMQAFMALKQIESFEELDYTYARDLVKMHILRNVKLNEDQFITAVNDGQINTPTDFGSFLKANYGFRNDDVDDEFLEQVTVEDELTIYLDNMASVVEFARPTANGTVYVLGGVIRPLVETVFQKLKDYQEFTIFLDAVVATGLDSLLQLSTDTTYNLGGGYNVNDINYTCFVAADEIYNQAGIFDLQSLVMFLQAGDDYQNPNNSLNQYVRYHLSDRIILKNELLPEEDDMGIFDTLYEGEVFITEHLDGNLIINKEAALIRSDIPCRNGVIQKIDKILPVYQPVRTTLLWDFCDHKDIISITNASGVKKGLGNLFYTPLSNIEERVNLLDKTLGNLNEDDFQYQIQSKTGSWGEKIGFMKCKYVSQADQQTNTYNAKNNNLFIVNVGHMGWIQLKTPTIIKGKYRIELHHGATIALKSYYSTGSQTRFIFDNTHASTKYVWRGAPEEVPNPDGIGMTKNYVHKEVLFEELEFESSESHLFKAVFMDIKSSTGAYRQMWDYLKFIPID